MLMRCAAIFAALFFALWPPIAWAQDVTLRSRDGGVELSGNLLGFDGDFYRIQTQYGELTVDGSGVLCEGVGCPSLTDFVAQLSISGSATIGSVLLPALIEAFALRDAALEADFGLMVGCMVGSSLAMAPAVLLAQAAHFTDLDGPLLLAEDRDNALKFDADGVHPPVAALWG